MLTKIKFESRQIAEKIAEYLYDVQVDGNCIIFLKSEKEGFEVDKRVVLLAVALEGLQEKDYEYVNEDSGCINNDYNNYLERAYRNLASFRIANPQATAWMGGYEITINLFPFPDDFSLSVNSDFFLFKLSSNSQPYFSSQCGSKILSIEITVENRFTEFLFILKQLTNTCITLFGEVDKAVLTAKNIHTINVQYFLTIFCSSESQIIQFYPVNNNITIERF